MAKDGTESKHIIGYFVGLKKTGVSCRTPVKVS